MTIAATVSVIAVTAAFATVYHPNLIALNKFSIQSLSANVLRGCWKKNIESTSPMIFFQSDSTEVFQVF